MPYLYFFFCTQICLIQRNGSSVLSILSVAGTSKALGVKSENAIRAVSDTRYLPSLLKKKKREGRTYEAKPPTAIRKKTLKLGMFLAFSFFIFV